MREARKLGDNVDKGWANAADAAPRSRPSGQAALRLVAPRIDRISQGPSEAFVKLTRNPKLASPARFEPTEKGPNDVIM
jgi:hypothetical protein